MINRTYFTETYYDMPVDVASKYAEAIREAIRTGRSFDDEKKSGYMLSQNRGYQDKLYIGDISRIENHLEYKGEKSEEDDKIINVIMIDGPVTRDGDGCSYGSKDHRDQILYANTIPQVVGHLFVINTPGGAASARIDYEQAIADCREKGKPTVAWVDGLCCSAGQLVASLCDRTIAMNGRNTMGCIGTMCAFWGVANGTVDQDGYKYIELVSVSSPDKNAEYREALDGKTEKMQADLDALGEEFRNTVKANRPLVKEEHLTGKTFNADEVMDALVDEIGDYERAIEAVFELASGTLPAARTILPGEDPAKAPGGEGSEDMAQLTEQQKAAIATNAGSELTIGDGKVVKTTPGMFGPEQQEIGNPQNKNNMTNEEMKAAEAEAAQAAAQEQPAEGAAPAEEAPATEEPGKEAPATEEPGKEAPAAEKKPLGEAEGAATEAPSGEPEGTVTEEPSGEAERTVEEVEHDAYVLLQGEHRKLAEDYQVKADAFAQLAEEHNTQAAELASAKVLIADRDKEIESLNNVVSERDKRIEEMQATIQQLEKTVADKESEIIELAGHADPMTNGGEGVPADNASGNVEKRGIGAVTTDGMSRQEMIEALKKQDQELEAKRHGRRLV